MQGMEGNAVAGCYLHCFHVQKDDKYRIVLLHNFTLQIACGNMFLHLVRKPITSKWTPLIEVVSWMGMAHWMNSTSSKHCTNSLSSTLRTLHQLLCSAMRCFTALTHWIRRGPAPSREGEQIISRSLWLKLSNPMVWLTACTLRCVPPSFCVN